MNDFYFKGRRHHIARFYPYSNGKIEVKDSHIKTMK